MRRRRLTENAGYTRHPTSAPALALRTFGVTVCNCVSTGAYGNVRFHTYSIPRAQPAHRFVWASDVVLHPRPGGRGSPPLRCEVRWLMGDVITPHPPCTNPSVTAQSAATAPLSGEPRGGRRFAPLRICLPRCIYLRLAAARKGRRPRRPVFAGLPGLDRRRRWAWPTAPTFPTALPPQSTAQRMQIPRAQPAHHLARAHRRRPLTEAGRAWKPAPTDDTRALLTCKKDRSADRSFLRSLAAVHFGRLKRPRI